MILIKSSLLGRIWQERPRLFNNPVIKREIIDRLRKPGMFGCLAFLLVFLFFDILIAWDQNLTTTVYSYSWNRETFMLFNFFLMCFSFLMVPVLSASSINLEFERDTWEILTTTHLSTASIVLAKWLSSIAMLTLMILSLIPFYGILLTFGSLSPGEIAITFLMLFEGILIGSLIGLVCSTVIPKSVRAISATFILVFLYVVGLVIIAIICQEIFRFKLLGGIPLILSPLGFMLVFFDAPTNLFSPIIQKHVYSVHIFLFLLLTIGLFSLCVYLLSRRKHESTGAAGDAFPFPRWSNQSTSVQKSMSTCSSDGLCLDQESKDHDIQWKNWNGITCLALFIISVLLLLFHQQVDVNFAWESLAIWGAVIAPLLVVPTAVSSFRNKKDRSIWNRLDTTTLPSYPITWSKLGIGFKIYLQRFWSFYILVMIHGLFFHQPNNYQPFNLKMFDYHEYLVLVLIFAVFSMISGFFYLSLSMYLSSTSKNTLTALYKSLVTLLAINLIPLLIFWNPGNENKSIEMAAFLSPLAFHMHSVTYYYASLGSILFHFLILIILMAGASKLFIKKIETVIEKNCTPTFMPDIEHTMPEDANPVSYKEQKENLDSRESWNQTIVLTLFVVSVLLLWFHQVADRNFHWEPLTIWAVFLVPLLVVPYAVNTFRNEIDRDTWYLLCTTTLTPYKITWGKLGIGLKIFMQRFWSYYLLVMIYGLLINQPYNYGQETLHYDSYLMMVVILAAFHMLSGFFYLCLGMYLSATSKSTQTAYIKTMIVLLAILMMPFLIFWFDTSSNFVLGTAGFVSPLAFHMHSLKYNHATLDSILTRFLFFALWMLGLSVFFLERIQAAIASKE